MELKLALNSYYAFQRSSWLHSKLPENNKYNPPLDWKDTSLELINKVCKKHKCGYVAIAGTFWINKGSQRIEVSNPIQI